jgi:CRISPR-associated exonuclease Cas4
MIGLLLLALTVIAFIAWLFFYRRSRVGPAALGTIVYDDAGRFRPEEVLVSHRYGLKGKPDYIVRDAKGQFPVEVKSRACGQRGPYDGEKAQLFAYCLLVEEFSGEPVSSGLIEFAGRQWRLPFGERERRYVVSILDEIRLTRAVSDVPRNHSRAVRCQRCGFRGEDVCGQALR